VTCEGYGASIMKEKISIIGTNGIPNKYGGFEGSCQVLFAI